MKKLYKYIVLVIGILVFSACADEQLVISFGETGGDVILKLDVQTQDVKDVVVSRLAADDEKLYDLHFYVFDKNDKLTGYEKIESLASDEIESLTSGDIPSHGRPDGIPVSIRTVTGESYIYAVANINRSATYYLENNLEKDNVDDNITDYDLLNVFDNATLTIDNGSLKLITNVKDDLKNAVESSPLTRQKFLDVKFVRLINNAGLSTPSPSSDIFIMSGYVNDGNLVNIVKGVNNTGSIDGTSQDKDMIKLYRILAKNTLKITSPFISMGTGSSQIKKFFFTPKSYRLCNVPEGGTLIPNANISNVNQYLRNNVTEAVVESNYNWNFGAVDENGYYTIIFYYPENLQVAKQGANITQWKDREKNRWNTEGTQKTFTNADANAAYIEVQGSFVTYNADGTVGNETATMSYTIHLGDFSTTGSVSDFNVIRNSHYIYTVTVNGLEDLKVEAERKVSADDSSPVDNPYVEGLVVDTQGGEHYEVDAHYESRVMAFDQTAINKLKQEGSGYLLKISTPFGSTNTLTVMKEARIENGVAVTDDNRQPIIDTNIYDVDNGYILLATLNADGSLNKLPGKSVFSGKNKEEDYEWIKFVKNTGLNQPDYAETNDPISKYPCVYPGDGDEDNPRQWLNVFELLAQLYEGTPFDNGVAYYTCFIDENYYYDKPWTDYVDQDPRTMLIANDLDVSKDGKSMYAKVQYSISQRSISTFYNKNSSLIAFGTETIDEEEEFGSTLDDDDDYFGIVQSGTMDDGTPWTSDWYAWSSAWETNAGRNWTWYDDDEITITTTNNWGMTSSTTKSIDIKKIEGKQPLYASVAKACMSRNRDLDGSGIIEQNEVRWYLAGIEQYRALMYGQSVLNPDAYLISVADMETINTAYLYPSSSGWNVGDKGHEYRGAYHYMTPSSEYAIFWPEECVTTCRTNDGWGYAQLVRCVRTLESGTQTEDKSGERYGLRDPELFYDPPKDGNNTFELTGFEAARGYTPNDFAQHNEMQRMNELYSKFVVAKKDLDSRYPLSNIIEDEEDLCKDYHEDGDNGAEWRTPNQKEFALMISEIDDLLKDDYGIRTRFSGDDQHTYPADWLWPYKWEWHNTPGFWSDNGRINVGSGYNNSSNDGRTNNSTGLKVRCVRDKL